MVEELRASEREEGEGGTRRSSGQDAVQGLQRFGHLSGDERIALRFKNVGLHVADEHGRAQWRELLDRATADERNVVSHGPTQLTDRASVPSCSLQNRSRWREGRAGE